MLMRLKQYVLQKVARNDPRYFLLLFDYSFGGTVRMNSRRSWPPVRVLTNILCGTVLTIIADLSKLGDKIRTKLRFFLSRS